MDHIPVGLLLIISVTCIQVLSIAPPLLLTPLVKLNKTVEARKLSAVDPKLFLNVTSYSGFLTVDERYNSNTFFWYFPIPDKPVNDTPWLIWLQGGPGASSLDGLFDEIGPFQYDNGELKLREMAWTKKFSMLFVDNPIGAGYSFTEKDLGYSRNMTMYADNLYSALQQFLSIFPELRKAPFYIAGESYAGRYLPALGLKILEQGQLLPEREINLQGLIMGNPVLNREDVTNFTEAFYQWGLIDTQGVIATKTLQDQYTEATRSGNVTLAFELRDKLLDKLQDISMQQQTYNVLADDYHLSGFVELLAREDIRDALHVGDTHFDFDNNLVQKKLVPDFLSNIQPMVEKLLDHYRILIYCGQLDLTTPCQPNAEARRKKWRWNRRGDFLKEPRVPWWYNETIAGYVKKGGGLTEALVRGAGHMAPIEKPAQVLTLISDFITDLDPVSPPNYSSDPINTPEIVEPKTTEANKVTTQTVQSTTPALNNSATTINSTVPPVLPPSSHENNKVTDATTNNTANDKRTTTVQPIQGSTHEDTTTSNKVAPLHQPNENPSSQDKKVTATEPLKAPAEQATTSTSAGTIVSIVINVILVLTVIFGAVLYYRQRQRTADFFYSSVDNNSEDLFLT